MSLRKLHSQIDELRRLAAGPDLERDSAISRWCVAEHLDHCAKVAAAILEGIRVAKPRSRGINALGRVSLFVGWIPRGRGKAPDFVHGARVPAGDIVRALDEVERAAAGLPLAAFTDRKTPIVKHPAFGGLTGRQALRFLIVHNRHHMKIIRDIIGER